MQAYSDPQRESDETALPDLEIFQMTAEEVAQQDEDAMHEALKRFPLANLNSRDRDHAVAWAIAEYGITGGWYYWYCFPGCLPDSEPIGPFRSWQAAKRDA